MTENTNIDPVEQGTKIIDAYKALPISFNVPGRLNSFDGFYNGFLNEINLEPSQKSVCNDLMRKSADPTFLATVSLPDGTRLMFVEHKDNYFAKLNEDNFNVVSNSYLLQIEEALGVKSVKVEEVAENDISKKFGMK